MTAALGERRKVEGGTAIQITVEYDGGAVQSAGISAGCALMMKPMALFSGVVVREPGRACRIPIGCW
jgi:hypothetical protein